jgi:hypothetical protein
VKERMENLESQWSLWDGTDVRTAGREKRGEGSSSSGSSGRDELIEGSSSSPRSEHDYQDSTSDKVS